MDYRERFAAHRLVGVVYSADASARLKNPAVDGARLLDDLAQPLDFLD